MKVLKKMNDLWDKFINLKYIKQIFLFLPHNLFLFLLFIISLILLIHMNLTTYIPYYKHETTPNSTFEPIFNHSLKISLANVDVNKIENKNKNLDEICLLFATYTRKTNSIYRYIAYQNNEVIYDINFNTNILTDGQYSCFPLPNANYDNIKEYSIEIVPIKTDENNVITIFRNSNTNEPLYQLTENTGLFAPKVILIFVFMVFYLGLNYLINKKNIKIHSMWLLFSLIYIIPITLINPPYEVPDEPTHFFTSYRLSQYNSNLSFYENMLDGTYTYPQNLSCINYVEIQSRDKVTNFDSVVDCFQNTDNVQSISHYPNLGQKSAYIASALGIKIADIFTNSPMIIFYLGRLFNTLVSIFLIYQALKIAPKHKGPLLSFATIPMLLQQMCSYSYDSLLNTLCIFSIAVIFKLMYDKDANLKKYTILLLVCGMVIAHIKYLYLLLLFLLLLVPNERWNRKIDKYIYCFSIFVSSYLLGHLCNAIILTGNISTILSYSFTLLSIYIVNKFIFNKNTNKKYWVIYILSTFMAILFKSIYIFIPILLLLFLPTFKISNKYIKFGMPIFIALIISAIIIGHTYILNLINSVLGQKLALNGIRLIQNPSLIYNTFKLRGMFYLRGLFGYFGWFIFRLNDIYIFAYILLFIYIIITDSSIKQKWYDRIIVALSVLLGILAPLLSMYAYWSNDKLNYIDGVQGRYFLPILFSFVILFFTKRKRENKNLERNIEYFVNIILFVYVSSLLIFYY